MSEHSLGKDLSKTLWLMSSYVFLSELDSLDPFILALYPEEFIALLSHYRDKILFRSTFLVSRAISSVGTLSQ